MIPRIAVLLPLIAAVGCAAPDTGVQLLVPEDVEFPWNAAYDAEGDGLVAVVPFDVMVYDVVTGDPVPGAEVELASDVAGFVFPEDLVAGACDACLWDAYRDVYLDLDPDAGASPLLVVTDEHGLARVYAVIDSVWPLLDAHDDAVRIRVSLDDQQASILLLPR